MRALAAAASLVAALSPALALADTHLALDRFDVSPAGDSFFGVASPGIPEDMALHAKLTVDYAHLPLVLETTGTHTQVDQIVRQQTFANAGVAFELAKRFLFTLDVPVAIFQSGKDVGVGLPDASGAHVGDIRLGARARLLTLHPLFNVSVGGFFYAPAGSSTTTNGAYVSDNRGRGRADLIIHGDSGRYVWAVNAGADFRRSQTFATIHQGDMYRVNAAAGVRFFDNRFQVGPETSAYLTMKDPNRYNRNWEALLGVRYSVPHGINAGLAAGPGFSSGIGTPDFRVVGNIGYNFDLAPAPKAEPAPAPAPEPTPVVAEPPPAPPAPEPPPPDRDGDGVSDARDACVDVPGDAEHDGCPAPQDADRDGILDANDACPNEAGVANADAAKNGCPLVKVVGDQVVILEQIQFETNKDVIKPESEAVLENILAALKSLPESNRFLVEGFTDSRGSAKRNKALSESRAKSVIRWLDARGIAEHRFSAAGQGPKRPIATNDTEDGRKANRRVEIHIIH